MLYARAGNRGEQVVACSRNARAQGIREGMSLAEATALWRQPLRPDVATRRPNATPRPALPPNAPALHVEPQDPAADYRELLRLAEWCEQFSPLVGLEGAGESLCSRNTEDPSANPECLLLDVTGLGTWWGNERRLVETVVAGFQRLGYFVQAGLADTIGAAWAMAHFGLGIGDRGLGIGDFGLRICGGRVWNPRSTIHDPRSPVPDPQSPIPDPQSPIRNPPWAIVPPHGNIQALRALPVAALRLSGVAVDWLHQLGIDQIQQLLQLPRDSLRSRFGEGVLRRLDQATGAVEELLVAHRPQPAFRAHHQLEHPAAQRGAIERVVQQLVERVAQMLAEHDRGVLQLAVCLQCGTVDHPLAASNPSSPHALKAFRFRVDLFHPLADPRHLMDLVRMQLEKTTLPGPLQGADVRAVVTVRRRQQQQSLLADADGSGSRDVALLIDRLNSRLGSDRVLRPLLQAEFQPERACRFVSWTGREASPSSHALPALLPPIPGPNDRPLQLQHPPWPLQVTAVAPEGPPARFRYRNCLYQVAHAWGPERIETGWWRGAPVRRDYYRVETSSGHRFWLFRRLDDGQWFLHGIFI